MTTLVIGTSPRSLWGMSFHIILKNKKTEEGKMKPQWRAAVAQRLSERK